MHVAAWVRIWQALGRCLEHGVQPNKPFTGRDISGRYIGFTQTRSRTTDDDGVDACCTRGKRVEALCKHLEVVRRVASNTEVFL